MILIDDLNEKQPDESRVSTLWYGSLLFIVAGEIILLTRKQYGDRINMFPRKHKYSASKGDDK